MKEDTIIARLFELISPVVEKSNYELYHLELVKENGEKYLRIYIDTTDGISLEDCEKVSRAVSELLDVEDPISDAYYLEVSSPGIERVLYTDKHFEKYVGSEVVFKLKKLFNGSKKYEGRLIAFTDEAISVEADGKEIAIPREYIDFVRLKGEF